MTHQASRALSSALAAATVYAVGTPAPLRAEAAPAQDHGWIAQIVAALAGVTTDLEPQWKLALITTMLTFATLIILAWRLTGKDTIGEISGAVSSVLKARATADRARTAALEAEAELKRAETQAALAKASANRAVEERIRAGSEQLVFERPESPTDGEA